MSLPVSLSFSSCWRVDGAGGHVLLGMGQVTPLHKSSEEGHLEVTQYLVSQGATVNIQDNDGVSADSVRRRLLLLITTSCVHHTR
jgi:hypothetical protein